MKFTTHFELHSQTTRLFEGVSHRSKPAAMYGILTLHDVLFQGTWAQAAPKHPLQITTRKPRAPDFKFELLPLHSPLLRQSLLVSFPPLIEVGGQAVLGRQSAYATPWLTERHGYDPTCRTETSSSNYNSEAEGSRFQI